MLRYAKRAPAFLTILLALGLNGTNALSSPQLPTDWNVAGSHPENVDVDVRGGTMHLIANAPNAGEFGSVMQTISAAHYDGANVEFSADVRSAAVAGWVGLWMRVDGRDKRILAFDNMQTRQISGTTAWKRYRIVLPIDKSASDIAFGILIAGSGEAWMKNLTFRPVAASVAATSSSSFPLEPNLDFSPPKAP